MKRSAYEEKDWEAKSIVSGDKRRWMKNKSTNAENAAKLDQMGTLYIKLLSSKDKYLLTQEDLDGDRWKKNHVQEIPNRPAPMHQITLEECVLTEDEDYLDIDTGPFTVEEVQAAIVKPKGLTILKLIC